VVGLYSPLFTACPHSVLGLAGVLMTKGGWGRHQGKGPLGVVGLHSPLFTACPHSLLPRPQAQWGIPQLKGMRVGAFLRPKAHWRDVSNWRRMRR